MKCASVKQYLWMLKDDIVAKIENEVNKLLDIYTSKKIK